MRDSSSYFPLTNYWGLILEVFSCAKLKETFWKHLRWSKNITFVYFQVQLGATFALSKLYGEQWGQNSITSILKPNIFWSRSAKKHLLVSAGFQLEAFQLRLNVGLNLLHQRSLCLSNCVHLPPHRAQYKSCCGVYNPLETMGFRVQLSRCVWKGLHLGGCRCHCVSHSSLV